MLALGLTPKANEQSYEPEWITAGPGVRRPGHREPAHRAKQWSHAFGIAYNAESEPLGASYPYAAYKQMRPNDEPAFGVEEIYYQMYMLAIGIQMAGPNLTPETFEAGHVRLSRRQRPARHVGLRARRLHAHRRLPRDLVEHRRAISPQNNKPGAWVQLNGGAALLRRPGAARPGAVLPVARSTATWHRTTRPRAGNGHVTTRRRSSTRRSRCAARPDNPHLLQRLRSVRGRRRAVRPHGRCWRRASRPSRSSSARVDERATDPTLAPRRRPPRPSRRAMIETRSRERPHARPGRARPRSSLYSLALLGARARRCPTGCRGASSPRASSSARRTRCWRWGSSSSTARRASSTSPTAPWAPCPASFTVGLFVAKGWNYWLAIAVGVARRRRRRRR